MNEAQILGQQLAFALEEAFYGQVQGAVFLDDNATGMLGLLNNLTAAEASKMLAGNAIAAHARHLSYSLTVYLEAVNADDPSHISNDWPAFDNSPASAECWAALLAELEGKASKTISALKSKKRYTGRQPAFAFGALAHTAFHLGIIQVKYNLIAQHRLA